MSVIKRIAVLTSGGYAPGMNAAAIRAVTRCVLAQGWDVFGVRHGYAGLVEGEVEPLMGRTVSNIMQRGGTMLGSARCPEFETESTRRQAISQLEQNRIDALVVIGGNGSQTGAFALAKMGLPVVGVASIRSCSGWLPFWNSNGQAFAGEREVGMNDSQKDPVCGMVVMPGTSLPFTFEGQTISFCSEYCRDKFQQYPKRYLATTALVDDDAKERRRVAYFTMEIALDPNIPTYSGGLGVLAGDMLRACADLNVPVVGVSMLWRKGYFEQVLDAQGRQQELPVQFEPGLLLRSLPERVEVSIEGRTVRVCAWQYDVGGACPRVPVILLDTDVEENSEYDRSLTACLYGGDPNYRLAQETILGIGGVRMLRALGYCGVQRFHMNEGHASLLVLELMNWKGGSAPDEWDFEDVRQRCIFTTHTPVPAGHDQFDWPSVERIAAPAVSLDVLRMLGGQERLNMTLLGLNLSRYVNGVAQRHEEVSREMFPGYPIHHITNGVHSATWTCESFQRLYDEYIPDWRKDPAMLRKALSIPNEKISAAHEDARTRLFEFVKEKTGRTLSSEALTIGFARRATAYKRAGVVFADPARLVQIARTAGPLQFVFAGKAHPQDEGGKREIEHIVAVGREIGQDIPVVYLENYDLEMARLLVSGVDLWLNTPQRPMEASGTSGMKAAHNGVPSFSTLDGWWIEGHIEGVTGWSIGASATAAQEGDAKDLLSKLEEVILPTYFHNHEQWMNVMRHTIALNASYFNTHRMVQQYVTNAYVG